MIVTVFPPLKLILIDIINRNNNTNYSTSDIISIRFSLPSISIWMNDENRFYVKYNSFEEYWK